MVNLAITGKLCAVLPSCPIFTGLHQLSGKAQMAVGCPNIDAFQIADRRRGCTFHIVMAQLALGKSHRSILPVGQEEYALS